MKYTVDIQLKPIGTFSVTEIVASSKVEAKTSALETAHLCGYSNKMFKKITVKEKK